MAEYAETQFFDNERFESDSINSRRRSSNKALRHYTVSRVFNDTWRDGKFYKNVIINMHGSGDSGSLIRNAVTGAITNYVVGSKDQDLFYKVAMCTGLDRDYKPVHLFYDSPTQYENHQFTYVSDEAKELWSERFLEAKERIMKFR
jgi:hypothetical protein